MKTFTGYLYHTDKVVVNPELKPSDEYEIIEDLRYMAVWEEDCIEVENAEHRWICFPVDNKVIETKHYSEYVKDAQPCTCKMSGEKAVVLTLNT